jgi:two-component system sensor histidine kinase DesK
VTSQTVGTGRSAWWTPRRSRWLLVAVHIPFVVAPPIYTILGLQGRPRGDVWVIAPLAAAIAGLQLWHSFAAARDERPKAWPWTLALLVALVYTPMLRFTWNWAAMQIFVIASSAMHLRGRAAAVAVGAPILGTTAAAFHWAETDRPDLSWGAATISAYWLAGLAIQSAILYGAARLVRALDELYAARADLAQAAVGSEWSRVSRDLHDVLGQSLAAVSLKGDLALALLPTDRRAAEAEIRSLTDIARTALRDTRMVTRGEHTVSLRLEASRAAHLLEAAGIDARIDVSLPGMSAQMDEALAWATREGVTNVMRHSKARHCSITAVRADGVVRLEIVNDGATDTAGPGSGRGLLGMADRARELGGSASAERFDEGRFVLCVELPEVPA